MDLSKYAALFLAESREHLSSCNQYLLEWERDPAAAEPVAGLFRAIHTIKGMAATMGYDGVSGLAHGTENLLDAVRAGRVPVTPELIPAALQRGRRHHRAQWDAPGQARPGGRRRCRAHGVVDRAAGPAGRGPAKPRVCAMEPVVRWSSRIRPSGGPMWRSRINRCGF